MSAPIPSNEAERLDALYACNILDTVPETAFDDLAHLASQFCGVPFAAITFIDANRQWFKSSIGADGGETSRDIAFCAHTILQDRILIIPNTLEDVRFVDHPAVVGKSGVRFYAGVPVRSKSGFALGSLCVYDIVPHELSEDQLCALKLLAGQVSNQIELSRNVVDLDRAIEEQAKAQHQLRQSEMRLNEAQRVAQIGSWEYDVASAKITWTQEHFRLFGFDRSHGEPSYEEAVARFIPEDEKRVTERFMRAVVYGEDYEIDVRLRLADEGVRWIRSKGQAVRDETNKIVRVVGTAMDVTEQKRSEQALRESETRYRLLFEKMAHGKT